MGSLLKKKTKSENADDNEDEDDEPDVAELDLKEDDDGDLDAKPLVFRSLQFKYNFERGSESSIAFHKSLNELEDLAPFRSKTI